MLLHLILFVSLPAFGANRPSGKDYCDRKYKILCVNKGPHIACQYPKNSLAPACHNASALDMNEEMVDYIVGFINRKRQRLAEGKEVGKDGALFPPSKIMMRVEWDDELAYLAQRLSNQCKFMHDHCRAVERFPYAGQTVGEVRWRDAPVRAVRRVLSAWWGEKRRASPKDITEPFRLYKNQSAVTWGHFSQMGVWSLRAIGCGGVVYGPKPRLLLACDYSHNNMLGQKTILVSHSVKDKPVKVSLSTF